MKIEEQVLTVEQMQHLKKLGVEVKDTAFYYEMTVGEFSGKKDNPILSRRDNFHIACIAKEDYIPTLTLHEILFMLPYCIIYNNQPYKFHHEVYEHVMHYSSISDDCLINFCLGSMLEQSYNMLCWCAENGYLNKE